MLRSCVMSLSHCINFTALVAFFKLAGMWYLMINWKTTLCKKRLDFSWNYQIWDVCMKCIAYNTCSFIHEAYNVISGDVCTVLYTVRMTVEVWTDLVILPLFFAPQAYVLLHHFPSIDTSLCCLNESASSFKTVFISFITTDWRTTCYELKSHLLNSQFLLHKPYHGSVELSPHLWASYWNINGSLKIMVKLLNKFGNTYNRSVWLSATLLAQNMWMACVTSQALWPFPYALVLTHCNN